MNLSQSVLIQLLSKALNKDYIFTINNNTNWDEVIDLSLVNDVSSLAFFAFKELYNSGCKANISTEKLMYWHGISNIHEQKVKQQFEETKLLSSIFDRNFIRTYILKGATIASCYPNPELRYSCDVDIFLMPSNEQATFNAFDLGNSILESNGVNVDYSYYKHSEFNIHGIHFENHKYCCSIKRGQRTKQIELYLQGLLKDQEDNYIDGSKISVPSLLFQALFLIEHANSLFLYEKMSLKNICDWAMFKKYHKEKLNWVDFKKACSQFGLQNFVDTMDRLADFIQGLLTYDDLSVLDRRVLDDTLKEAKLPKNKMLQRCHKALDVLNSAWKFSHYGQSSMAGELFQSVYSFLFVRNIKLN